MSIKSIGLLKGAHLKRIKVFIQTKKNPEKIISGHALTHEVLPNQISFFANQKFAIDEELTVTFDLRGERQTRKVIMKSLHEQISSGKIMNMLPSEANLFPTQKYYRCYTQVKPEIAVAAPAEETASTDSAAPIAAAIEAAPTVAPVDIVAEAVAAAPELSEAKAA